MIFSKTSLTSARKQLAGAVCSISAIMLVGCGAGIMPSTAVTHPNAVKITGIVHGGQQAVTGATIQFYATGTNGVGSAAIPLLTSAVTTDGGGSFSLTGLYTCPSATANVYLVATGGNPGLSSGQTNANIALMSALGHCGNLNANSYVSINEVTTIAAVYGLAPYMSSFSTVGVAAGDAQLMDSAFDTAQELANSGTGATPGSNVVLGHTVQVSKLQTLANILSACVNTAGGVAGDTTPCGALFSNATSSGVVPTDTISALLSIALNPSQNVTSIFDLSPAVGPFQPSSHTVPNDWNLGLTPSASSLSITSAALPASTTGAMYSAQLQAAGGTPSYTWRLASGQLPDGLSLQATTGAISGRSRATGTATFTVAVLDASQPTQVVSTPLSITTIAPLTITSSDLSSGTAGTAYAATLQASGGTPSYTWSIASGSLPAGLSLAATTGVISGTPATNGVSNFTVTVSDSGLLTQMKIASTSITVVAAPPPAATAGTTWYVRPDGGTRYSTNVTSGQCDGLGDLPYGGVGINQHCAFKDVRMLWQDGSYTYGNTFPGWGWVGAGGDTYLIRGSLGTGVTYRVGYNSNGSSYCDSTGCWGIAGDPYNSPPAPPSGTASQHTQVLGENYASCHSASAKTQLHGGYGAGSVLNMSGASFVDVACLDITDFSSCGKAHQTNTCNTNYGSIDDYANSGIVWSNTATHDTLNDIHIHGLANAGMVGPTGDGVVMRYVDLLGNASSGWNADPGNGTTGTGSLLLQNYNISWNGCAEEYPLIHELPYADCTDDGTGGYGDGFGTATVASSPGWNVTFDQGIASYNTQDGLDALHLIGDGSSMTITHTLVYGNMGQQLKIGGSAGTAVNNVIVTNCNALRQSIPGTPAGYNSRLSDFCRAADAGLALAVQAGATLTFDFNTIYSASSTAVEVDCGGRCDATALMDFRNNIFVGFLNNTENGYPHGGSGQYSNPIYNGTGVDFFGNSGSVYSNNVTYHPKSNWTCPSGHEQNASCANPGLEDDTWHIYGYGDMKPTSTSMVHGAGTPIPGITTDYSGILRSSPPSIGAYD